MIEEVIIKQINDREIWINDGHMLLGDDNIIYCISLKEPDEQHALAVNDWLLKLAMRVEGRANVFLDISDTKRPTVKAKKIFSQMIQHKKIGKFAFFGAHPVARVLASFMIGIMGKRDVRFFKKKDEAIGWLKSSE